MIEWHLHGSIMHDYMYRGPVKRERKIQNLRQASWCPAVNSLQTKHIDAYKKTKHIDKFEAFNVPIVSCLCG